MTASQAAEKISDIMRRNLPTVVYNFEADPKAIGRTPGEQIDEIAKTFICVVETIEDESRTAGEVEGQIAALHHGLEMFWRCLALRNGQDYVDAIFNRHDAKLGKLNPGEFDPRD